jgi:carboxyl-terminal processing protease
MREKLKMTSKRTRWIALFSVMGLGLLAFKQAEDYFEISKNLDIFASVYKEVNTTYVDEVKPGELIKVSIDAMLKSLDPYTNFYSESEAEDYRFQVTGSYAGIGATIRQIGDHVVIDAPYEGFPAAEAGLKAGDKILEVDGNEVKGKTTSDLTKLLKGTEGTEVTLKLDRLGEGVITKTFKRAKIKVKNVPFHGWVDEETGYIKLTGFTPNAGKEVASALKNLKSDETRTLKGVILDLRGNGGGLLHEAVNIVNVFIPRGEQVVSTKSRYKETNRVYKTLNEAVDTEVPLVVLINGRSASASEIVSGSIQDLDRGILVGRTSFGKGLVQSTKPLTFNTQMKITTAKYYIPSGRCIQKLDYSHKKNGKAVIVADSSKNVFYTRNRREVVDGEGVTPDVKVKERELSDLTVDLLKDNHIFNFATVYITKNPLAPGDIREFNVGEDIFKQFVDYLQTQEFSFTTDTEKAIEALRKQADEERYATSLNPIIEELEEKLAGEKKEDIYKYKEEVMELIETELAERYAYRKGGIIAQFDDDPDIRTSIEIFNDPERYNRILTGN